MFIQPTEDMKTEWKHEVGEETEETSETKELTIEDIYPNEPPF